MAELSLWVISANGMDLWNPSQRRGHLFLSGVKALEKYLGVGAGVADIESDEILVDTEALERLVLNAVEHFDDPIFRQQAQGVAALSLVLIRRDRTLLLPPDLFPLWKISEELEKNMAR